MSRLTVHIIESLSAEDLRLSRTEGNMLAQALLLAGMTSTYTVAETRHEFEHALGDVSRQAAAASPSRVAIHFSCHGSDTRIALTSGDEIRWHELRHLLIPPNRALNGELIVGMSSCRGLHGAGMALHPYDSPFHSLVGPLTDVRFADAAVAFTVFYHQLAKGASVNRAVELMKLASGEEHFGVVEGEDTRTDVRQAFVDAGLELPKD